jgi:hypothetical protein
MGMGGYLTIFLLITPAVVLTVSRYRARAGHAIRPIRHKVTGLKTDL